MVPDSLLLISPGARQAPATPQEDTYQHGCPGCTSCETPARALEIFQKIVWRCPITSLFLTERLHIPSKVPKHVSGILEILLISTQKHDIRLYLRMS